MLDVEDVVYASVHEAIVAECDQDWWGSLRGTEHALLVLAKTKARWNLLATQKGARWEMRKHYARLIEQANRAVVEIKARRFVLGETESEKKTFERIFRTIVRERYGKEVWDDIIAEAQRRTAELMAVRDTPMSAGSVLSPASGGGGMRQRK